MKKSLRILSLILAVVMMMGSLSVLGSAGSYAGTHGKSPYKGNGTIKNNLEYDDVNKPVYTLDQYATMALDEVDRMLVDAELGVIDVYLGTLELESVDGTVTSVAALIDTVKDLATSGLLGDGKYLVSAANALIKSKWSPADAEDEAAYTKRANGDITVLWDLLDLIGGVDMIVYKYVNHTLTVGILDGLIGAYLFNVKELIFGALLGVTGMADTVDAQGNKVKYDYFDTFELPDDRYKGDGASMLFLQDVINNLVLGEWKKLDNLFYNKETNPNSAVVYSEFMFRDGSANGALLTGAELDTAHYDYYGWVHPEEWVTFGLGDAIRVSEGATAPAASYSKVDVANMPKTYDFIEALLQQAYNGIAVPVLNRITASWLREEMGYVFESRYTEKWLKDVKGNDGEPLYDQSMWYDENGDKVRNPQYDYFYMGSQPEGAEIDYSGSGVYKLFDPENLHIPYAEVADGKTFIDELNHNAGRFVKAIVKATTTTSGAVTTYVWTDPSDASVSYTFTWTDGTNDYLLGNIINLVRFVLQVTGDEFFDKYAVERNEIKTAAELQTMDGQAILSYIIREIINSSVDYMFIEENNDTNTIAGAGLEAVIQLAAQDLPGIDYRQNMPTRQQNNTFGGVYYADTTAYYNACIDKALAILMDVAAFKLNCELDTEYATIDDNGSGYVVTNSGTKNQTGLLSIQGNTGVYGTNLGALIAWAISYWASKPARNKTTGAQDTSNYVSLLNVDFLGDNQGGAYEGFNEDTFWTDLDSLLNAIIPIDKDNTSTQDPDNRPWIHNDIASSDIVSKAFILDYLVKPIVTLNFTNIYKIFERNNSGAFAYDNFETVLIDLLNRVFDLLFPNVFMKRGADTIDDVLDNENLARMAADLIITLSATGSRANNDGRPTANAGTISGRGMIIADVALPIVCLVLGLHDDQEFEELENMIPETITPSAAGTVFKIFNGSSGVNTSYRDEDGKRHVDDVYSFVINSATTKILAGSGVGGTNNPSISGFTNNVTTVSGGEFKDLKLNNHKAGQLLEITIKYTVYDENNNTLGAQQVNTSYTYVSDGSLADDEAQKTYYIDGKAITAPENLYITGGLSSLENFSFRIKDDKSNAGVENPDQSKITTISVSDVTVTGANTTWARKLTYDANKVAQGDRTEVANKAKVEQTLTAEGGTFVFTPFVVDDPAFRWSYEYQKDADGNYVLDKYGLKRRAGLKALEDGQYYVPDGDYVITTTFTGSKGGSVSIPVKVHIYNDFGLPGLVDSCIAANLSEDNLTSAGKGKWSAYRTALYAGAGLTLPPHTTGNGVDGKTFYESIQPTATVVASEEEENLNIYEQYYKQLYYMSNELKKPENTLSSGAQTLWEKVNSYRPYNYTRASYQVGDTTCWYKNGLAYDDPNYVYFATCNYVSHTFTPFRKAVNHANDLIDREYKYIAASQADYNKYDAKTQTALLNAYKQAEASKGVISSVESAYAIHMLDLTYARLIEVNGDKTKLNETIAKYGQRDSSSYSTESAADYDAAKAFALRIQAKSNANSDEINTAMNTLIETYKEMIKAADYTKLATAVEGAKDFISNLATDSFKDSIFDGDDIVLNPEGQTVGDLLKFVQEELLEEEFAYTVDSVNAYMNKLVEANAILTDTSVKLGKDQQERIDALADLLNNRDPENEGCILKAADSDEPGDDPDEPGEGGDGSDIEFIEGVEYDCGDDVVEAWIDNDILESYDCGEDEDIFLGYVEYDDIEYYIEGVIYGLPEEFDEDVIDELFDYDDEKYTFDYICLNEKEEFSSGTIVSFYSVDDEDEEEPLRSFLIAYRGDLDGDLKIGTIDFNRMKKCVNKAAGYRYYDAEEENWVIGPAADINGDGKITVIDANVLKRVVVNKKTVINQADGGTM